MPADLTPRSRPTLVPEWWPAAVCYPNAHSPRGPRIVRNEPSSGHPSAPVTPPASERSSLQSRVSGRFSRQPRRRLMLIGGGFVALLACLLALGAVAEDVHDQEANALDALATPLLHALSNPILDAVMGTFTTLGSTIV